MRTERLLYTKDSVGQKALERAAQILREGGLVAFPTETVYGLGALALDPAAVRRIFEAKGRPAENPLIVHVSNKEQARKVAASWPGEAERLAERFWPGPLTLVLPKAEGVPDEVSGGLPSVGIRVPAHPLARALIQRVGQPLAAPSANRYTAVSPTQADHVAKTLDGRIEAILDGGSTAVGIESTVLELGEGQPRILRPGAVTKADIEEVIGSVRGLDDEEEGAALPSPGLARKHYAPDLEVRLLYPLEIYEAGIHAGAADGFISLQPRPFLCAAQWIQLPDDPAAYARQLYGALHAMEDARVRRLYVEVPPPGPEWEGVHDRLRRAAG